MSRKIPPLWLEQYALGELSPARRAEVEAALGEELPAELARLSRDGEALLQANPPPVFAARVAAAQPRRRWPRWASVGGAAGVAVAAAVALFAAPALVSPPPEAVTVTAAGERAKGGAMLQLHRRIDGGAEALAPGAAVGEGDVLQLSYTATDGLFGAIGSVDGRGVLTWHLPLDGREATRLQPGAGVPLAHSYELDDAPGAERFFFVTSPAPFALDAVGRDALTWAEDPTQPLQLVAPLRATVFVVDKRGAR